MRYHAIGDGTKPTNRIILAVEELKQKRHQNPKQWPDSIYQKELNKIKRGELGNEKIPTMTVVIKPTDNSTFDNMIDALDEMQILSIGTYVIDKLNDKDLEMLKEKNVEL